MTAPVPPATGGGPLPGEPAGSAAGERAGSAAAEPAGAVDPLAARIVRILAARGQTAATAESLTGGLVAAALTSVPGSSAVFVGGVIAYATPLKTALLGVPADLLAEHGPVHPDVATAMARGVRDRLGATYGLSTTGVAGPGAAEGIPAGTVYVAVAGAAAAAVVRLALPGGRARVRQAAVQEVLALLVREVPEDIS